MNSLYTGIRAVFGLGKQQSEYNRKFQLGNLSWEISIPENFKEVTVEKWASITEKGEQAMSKSTGEPVDGRPEVLFVSKADDANFVEASWRPYDQVLEGNYEDSCARERQILLQAFKTQLPEAQIESAVMAKDVSGLDFQVFNLKAVYTNGLTVNSLMYHRLCDDFELLINLMFIDPEYGRQMQQMLNTSAFETAEMLA